MISGIPQFDRPIALRPLCKACDKPLRSPVAVLDRGLVLLQWTCLDCDAVAVQEVGEADYGEAVLKGESLPSELMQEEWAVQQILDREA